MLSRRLFCASAAATLTGAACAQQPPALQTLRLTAPRAVHGMVALADGSALIIGGCVARSCEVGPASSTVDRYDPVTKSIQPAGRLRTARVGPAAVVVADQTVLIAGGWSNGRESAAIERFDPAAGRSERVGAMSAAQLCSVVTLQGGRVLLVGEKSIEAWDPRRRSLERMSDTSPYRESSTATALSDGRVLIAGGGIHGPPTDAAFLFDPSTGRITETGRLSAPRRKHAAVRLQDGRVLIVGGSGDGDRDDKTRVLEVYDPARSMFSVVGQALDARYKIADATVLMDDGRVLVAGGAENAELIDPRTWRSNPVEVPIGTKLNFSCAVRLAGGDVLVAGGYGERTINPVDQAWVIPRGSLV